MRSKTSCFNGTLFRKNLSRYWPLWGLASFGGAMFPLAMLLELLHDGFRFWSPLETRQAYYTVLSYGVPVISIVYAILCAMAVWSYLYNARSVGMMHTLPIRREGLFVTNVLSGLTMMAIPYAVTGVLLVLVTMLFGGFEPMGVLVTVLGVMGESLFFFGLATLCAFIVGNVFMLPALYGLLNFIAVLTDFMVNLLAQGFCFGLNSSYSDTVAWLSDAIAGKAWRGTEYNLAYRRDTFFRNKGFSSCLNLRHGDDDIFVSQVATRANTAVELSDESVVTVPGSNTLRALRDRNVQRRFTRRFIHRRPRLLGAMGWWPALSARR